MKTRNIIALFLALVLLAGVLSIAAAKTKDPAITSKDIDTERNLGKQGAEDAAKNLKFVTDPKYLKRVESIGAKIAAVAKITKVPASYGAPDLADFNYAFKVVDDKAVNAFSLPAGYVYVNKGLLDRVESDDELAGVIAHECGHVAHHHMLKLLRKQSQIDSSVLLIIAAAALGKANTGDVANLYYGAKLVEMAKMNTWSREAEYDADATGLEFMIRAGYNPVGMLTVLEGLAREETYNPSVANQGVTQDHPLSADRAKNVIDLLGKKGIVIDRYKVESGTQAEVKEVTVKNKKVSQVIVGDKVLYTPADSETGTSPIRARGIADAMNRMLKQNPDQWEVRLSPDGFAVYLKDVQIVEVAQSDADLAGSTREALATKTKAAIQSAILTEQMRLMY